MFTADELKKIQEAVEAFVWNDVFPDDEDNHEWEALIVKIDKIILDGQNNQITVEHRQPD